MKEDRVAYLGEEMTHDKNKAIAAARECNAFFDVVAYGRCDNTLFSTNELERFYAIAFEDGRQAEREECVGIYKSLFNLYLDRGYPEQQMAFLIAALDDFIEAIHARGDTK